MAACNSDDVYDFGATLLATFPAEKREAIRAALLAPNAPELDAALDHAMRTNGGARCSLHPRHVCDRRQVPAPSSRWRWTIISETGSPSRSSARRSFARPRKTWFFQGQPQQLFVHLTCPKAMIKFTDAEGAGAHCKMGASRLAYARIYDWLDETQSAVNGRAAV